MSEQVRINEHIRSSELRVIGAEGENLGVISRDVALKHAREAGLDLIEISAKANPPVAKITDYGKFLYLEKKKARDVKSKSFVTETKTVQVKIGTGDHDLNLKARRVSSWLAEGHRVRIDLFLWGRYKYMEESFLRERLERFLKLIAYSYKVADTIKKSPKGMTVTVEPDKAAEKQKQKGGDKSPVTATADTPTKATDESPTEQSSIDHEPKNK